MERSRAVKQYLLVAVAAMALPVGARAQDEAERGCRAFAGLSSGADYADIYVKRGRVINRASGNFELTWEAWATDTHVLTGRCEADVRGAIVKFERIDEHDGRKPGSAGGGLGRLSLDTPGRGSFAGLGINSSVDRATALLQEGRATISFYSGGNRVAIMGAVTAQPSEHEFTIAVDSTDRSRNAQGNMTLRVNQGHSAIEAINVTGRSGRQQFNGNFSR